MTDPYAYLSVGRAWVSQKPYIPKQCILAGRLLKLGRIPGRKAWLNTDETARILELAKDNPRNYLIILLLRYSFRLGEVVGDHNLHGIRTMDLRADGIWIKGKGGGEYFVSVKASVMKRLFEVAPKKQEERLFPLTERRVEQFTKDYARKASVRDWEYVSPHRLRAYYATDLKERGVNPFEIRDGMRHKSIETTNIYIGPTSRARMSEIAESL